MIDAFKLRLEIEGTEEAVEELLGIAERARDARPVLRVIQEMMRLQTIANFASEGEVLGLKWLPDKAETIRQKLAAGFPDRTEVMTGDLFEALSSRGGGGNAIRRLSAKSTTFGTRLPYAQFAGHKRLLLAITAHEADRYTERMAKFLMGEPT